MLNYKLSKKAEKDLLDIASYGLKNFGISQSEKYKKNLKKRFTIIGGSPFRYPTVDHIRSGYRRSVCGVHSIYYKIGNDGIPEIMRILKNQNIKDM